MKIEDIIHTDSFDDVLMQFLRGQLSDDDADEFLRLLDSDPELRSRTVATARMIKAMQREGEELDRDVINELRHLNSLGARTAAALACGDRNAAISTEQPSRLVRWRRLIVSISAAASIILCVFGAYRYHEYTLRVERERLNSLGVEYLAYLQPAEFDRNEIRDSYGQEYVLHRRGHRPDTVTILNGVIVPDYHSYSGELDSTMYLEPLHIDTVAVRLKELYPVIKNAQQLDAPIAQLNSMWNAARSDSYNDYTDHLSDIGWMLANAYLRANDRTRAIQVLDQLIAYYPADTALGAKARELKAKVEEDE